MSLLLFLVDRSGSMRWSNVWFGKARFEVAQEVVEYMARQVIGGDTSIGLFTFADNPLLEIEPAVATQEILVDIGTRLTKARKNNIGGDTDIWGAMDVALNYTTGWRRDHPDGVTRLIILTDGGQTVAKSEAEKEKIRKRMGEKVFDFVEPAGGLTVVSLENVAESTAFAKDVHPQCADAIPLLGVEGADIKVVTEKLELVINPPPLSEEEQKLQRLRIGQRWQAHIEGQEKAKSEQLEKALADKLVEEQKVAVKNLHSEEQLAAARAQSKNRLVAGDDEPSSSV